MTENLAPGLLPLSNFNVNTASEDLVALVLPSVLLFNSYPIDADVQLGSEQWEGYISDLERMEELSQQYERPFWHTAQGFFNSAARRPSIPAELRAIAGLTIGHSAKGIYYFIRSTFGGNEGLLNVDFENTEMMNQVALENERLTAFGPKLKELQSADEIEVMTDDADIFARSFKDSSGNFFIIAVNKNTLIGKRPMLTVNGVEAGVTSEEMLEVNGFPQFRPLPNRQDGQDLTIALSILPPGDWTIVSIKSD